MLLGQHSQLFDSKVCALPKLLGLLTGLQHLNGALVDLLADSALLVQPAVHILDDPLLYIDQAALQACNLLLALGELLTCGLDGRCQSRQHLLRLCHGRLGHLVVAVQPCFLSFQCHHLTQRLFQLTGRICCTGLQLRGCLLLLQNTLFMLAGGLASLCKLRREALHLGLQAAQTVREGLQDAHHAQRHEVLHHVLASHVAA
mmetsp:Transcript_48738/g.123616  ORF Transcript_48738/g.123616 Transcript_48738/m.123616 type:complete len:202 (+) Transcript_48738:1195-1800(+)